MNASKTSVRNTVYGLSFTIEDLVTLREWAAHRHLQCTVMLDRTLDGMEFEELVIMAIPGAKRPTLTLWQSRDGVFAQTPDGAPHGFETVDLLLAQIRPTQPRKLTWLQRLRTTR